MHSHPPRPVVVGHVLTEASYSFIDNRGTPATNSFPELLIRRGATERREIHAEWFGSWTDGLEDEKVRPFVGPEGITRDQLQADYGGIGGAETQRLLGEIDRRIAALPLYRWRGLFQNDGRRLTASCGLLRKEPKLPE